MTTRKIRASQEEAQALPGFAQLTAANLHQIVTELFQNARRSGATAINVRTPLGANEGRHLTVTDNGRGIADPQVVLEYGTSIWPPAIIEEHPEGLGILALASRQVVIESRPASADDGTQAPPWRMRLGPSEFRGKTEAVVKDAPDAPEPHGTRVTLSARGAMTRMINELGRYYRVPVTVDGKAAPQEPFLKGAFHTTRWRGIRIGIFPGRPDSKVESLLSFHGALAGLRGVSCQRGQPYARAEVEEPCPELWLERPGLGTVIPTDFSKALNEILGKAIQRVNAGRAPEWA